MASAPHGGDARLAGLEDELRRLRGRLEAVRRGIVEPERAPVPPAAADDEVVARLRRLLDELRAMTGESPQTP